MTQPADAPKRLSPTIRYALLFLGFFAVALGVAGIFLPVLPTVPFLLLAAACFTRSSERFYTWLMDHAHLGPMVRPYIEGQGLRNSAKKKAISLIWISITLSIYLLKDRYLVQGALAVVAIGITLYLLQLPTIEEE